MSSLSAELGPGIGCFTTELARTISVASTRPLCSPEALAKLAVSALVPLPRHGTRALLGPRRRRRRSQSSCPIAASDLLIYKLAEGDIGSAQGGFNAIALGELEITYPKLLKGQKVVIVKLDELSAETQRLESIYQRKLAMLDELKKSLLHQAFTGQLTQDERPSAREAATHG